MTKPAGTRPVSEMSLEEVYRKRAIDRENQRAFRSRQKRRIDELEGERNDLKQCLALANEQISRLQAREAELLEHIHSAQALLGRCFGPPASVAASASAGSPATTLAGAAVERASPPAAAPPPAVAVTVMPQQRQDPVQARRRQQQEPTPPYSVSVQELTDKNSAVVDPSTGISFDLSQLEELDASIQFWDDFSYHSGGPLGSNALAFAFPPPTMLDQIPDVTGAATAAMPMLLESMEEDHQAASSRLPPIWARLPLHIEPATKLDKSLLGITEAGRRHVATLGKIPTELAEESAASFPSVASLLNPGAPNQKNAIATAIGHDCKILVTAKGLPERIAFMYNMCNFVRWLISPTKRNYEALPDFMRPVEAQLTTPHPLWVDLLVWPRARERAARGEMDWAQFERFKTSCAISANWDRELSEILRASEDKTELSLSPEFERHVRELRNWTIGKEAAVMFPCFDCIPTEVGGG